MKKTCIILLAAMLILTLFTGCAKPTQADQTVEPTPEVTDTPNIVVFADPVLEQMVRDTMSKPEGDITAEEAEAVTELNLSVDFSPDEPAEGTVIKDLSGLENFKNLEVLELHFHAITDISPLAGITNLTSLSLGGNQITDISPLAGLTNLTWLTLFNCQAQDYSPLSGLTNLDGLLIGNSTISDVSVLSGLTKLQRLGLNDTQVSDVSPLANLTNLKELELANCPITDYSPLTGIYPNLEEADFSIVSSLRELGFVPIDNAPQTESYKTDEMYIHVNHTEWGEQENKDEENAVILCKKLRNR